MKNLKGFVFLCSYICINFLLLNSCGIGQTSADPFGDKSLYSSQNNAQESTVASTIIMEESTAASSANNKAEAKTVSGTRDNTIVCLEPSATGITVYSNSVASIDASNASEGYVAVSYFGACPKVKLQITKNDCTTYTYNLTASRGYDFFPFSDGSGTYSIGVYENAFDNQYAVALMQTIDVSITNTYGPNLYPNQYVSFSAQNQTVKLAAELVSDANDDLSAITSIYNYVSSHISYDYNKAETVQSGYLCDIDATLNSGTGICLDYASVMCAMLRSQRIPTRLEVGYAGSAYHAWISTYIEEIGWVNGIIQFDGVNWQIMDPTFASTSDSQQLKSFIGDGTNYQTKYVY